MTNKRMNENRDVVKAHGHDGPVDVECAGKFSVWAATKHAGYDRVTRTFGGCEVKRVHRDVRGWCITHVPSGYSIPIKVSRPVAVKLAEEIAVRWPRLGARWKLGKQSYSPANLAALRAVRDFVIASGVELWEPRA